MRVLNWPHVGVAFHFLDLRILVAERRTREQIITHLRRSIFMMLAARRRKSILRVVSLIDPMMWNCEGWPKLLSSIRQLYSLACRRGRFAGIAAICPKIELAVHACTIMPDHVHVVVAANKFDGDELVACLKRVGTREMNNEGLHPMRDYIRANGRLPSPWAGGGWKVMLFTAERMRAAIRYVEQNPVRAGYKRQNWSFVVPFEG